MTALDKVSLFSALSSSDVELLESRCVRRRYPKGAIVVNEGETTDSLYIVETGKLKVFLCDEGGKEVTVSTLGPGEYFGELALIDDEPRSASVMAVEACVMRIMLKETFRGALKENPSLALSLLKGLAKKTRALTEKVKGLALKDVYGRVTETLESLAQPSSGKTMVLEKITQQDIANRVGASREMVARIMKDLTAGGYITVQDRSIIINGKLPGSY